MPVQIRDNRLILTKPLLSGKINIPFAIGLLAAAILLPLAIWRDHLESAAHGWSFYFSESLLFNSFWLLFPFLIWLQLICIKQRRLTSVISLLFFNLLWAALHLVAYPALVWLLSAIGYYHTFRYGQTLQYAFVTYFIWLVVIYQIVGFLLLLLRPAADNNRPLPSQALANGFAQNIMVSRANERKLIPVSAVQLIKASAPYITICCGQDKYLETGSLQKMADKLDPSLFLRIHKSTIVNLQEIQSWQSRGNGDYDIVLHSQEMTRLSRNYAANFKQAMARLTQDAQSDTPVTVFP